MSNEPGLGSWGQLVKGPATPAVVALDKATLGMQAAARERAVKWARKMSQSNANDAGDLARATRAIARAMLADGEGDIHAKVAETLERALVSEVLLFYRGNKFHASAALGWSYAKLTERCRRFGLYRPLGRINSGQPTT